MEGWDDDADACPSNDSVHECCNPLLSKRPAERDSPQLAGRAGWRHRFQQHRSLTTPVRGVLRLIVRGAISG